MGDSARVKATRFNRSNRSKEDRSEHWSPGPFAFAFIRQEWWVPSATCPQTGHVGNDRSTPFPVLKTTASWSQFCFQLKEGGQVYIVHFAYVMLSC